MLLAVVSCGQKNKGWDLLAAQAFSPGSVFEAALRIMALRCPDGRTTLRVRSLRYLFDGHNKLHIGPSRCGDVLERGLLGTLQRPDNP
jgi:hypothetical protein